MIFKFFAYCLTAAMTLFLLWGVGWIWFAAYVVSMKPYDLSAKTDAIIVLTGGGNRVNTGLDLLNRGSGKYLFISGVNPKVKTGDLVSLWGQKKMNTKRLEAITLGYSAETTAANAIESEEWIKNHNIDSIWLVTSNYHMARASLIFHKKIPGLIIRKHPVVPDDFEPWKEQFWPLTFSEYNKFLATWLRLDLLQKKPSLIKGSA